MKAAVTRSPSQREKRPDNPLGHYLSGITLLVEFLRLDLRRIDFSELAAEKYYHLENILGRLKRRNAKGWRKEAADIQEEIRRDMFSIIDPLPRQPGERWPYPKSSDRLNRLWHLVNKLAGMNWRVTAWINWGFAFRALVEGAPVFTSTSGSGAQSGHGLWKPFKIDDETFLVQQQSPARGSREELYWIIYLALTGGYFSELKVCRQCRSFYVSKRRNSACSTRCKNALYNRMRRDPRSGRLIPHSEYVKQLRQNKRRDKLIIARRMLKERKKPAEIKERTGLGYRILEREGLIDPDADHS